MLRHEERRMNLLGPKMSRGLGIVLCALLVVIAWYPGLESAASQRMDSGLKRALVSFASARALNAVIALAQGTEVAAQPLGIGVTLKVGQVLEPVNRLAEHFGNVMLFAAVAFGIEKTLLLVGGWWAVSLALSAAVITLGAYQWKGSAPRWLCRFTLLLLLVRFAIPVSTIGADFLFHQFMAPHYEASQKAVESTSVQIDTLASATTEGASDRTLPQRIREAVTAPVKELRKKYEALANATGEMTSRIVDLIAIFILQTLIFPLLLLWMMFLAFRALTDWAINPA
jgi:hypothetical protein